MIQKSCSSRAIDFLKDTKSFLTQDTLKMLYTGNVDSHFRYCYSLWGNFGVMKQQHMQKFQNGVAMILKNSTYDYEGRPLPLPHCVRFKKVQKLVDNEFKL